MKVVAIDTEGQVFDSGFMVVPSTAHFEDGNILISGHPSDVH
jgi:hypothetical protein